MQLHELKRKNSKKEMKKRVGRGGKRGTYSGKGQKGQKSRAGAKIRPAARDTIIRTPKLRGYKNKIKHSAYIPVTLDYINKIEEKDITQQIFIDKKVINRKQKVKILNTGDIKLPKNIIGINVSKSASVKILKAGGSIKNNNT